MKRVSFGSVVHLEFSWGPSDLRGQCDCGHSVGMIAKPGVACAFGGDHGCTERRVRGAAVSEVGTLVRFEAAGEDVACVAELCAGICQGQEWLEGVLPGGLEIEATIGIEGRIFGSDIEAAVGDPAEAAPVSAAG